MPHALRIAAICIAAAVPAAQAQETPDPRVAAAFARLDPWLRSVVRIEIQCPGARYPSVGSGVLIRATGEVLSAAHVGSDCPEVKTAKLGPITSPYSAPKAEIAATLRHRIVDARSSPTQAQITNAEFQDLALWKIDDMTGVALTPATIATAFPMPGDPVEVVGFAGLPYWHGANGAAGANAGPGLTRFRTTLTSVGASSRDLPYRLHYPGVTLGGVSGGPVFNAAGEVIGIHSTRTTSFVGNTMTTGCGVDTAGNCVRVMVPDARSKPVAGTIGIGIGGIKSVLENYGWATSILAVPADW